MRSVVACQRAQRLGEWRTDSDGRCTYHSDGKRTVTAASLATYALSKLSTRMFVVARINEVSMRSSERGTIQVRPPKL